MTLVSDDVWRNLDHHAGRLPRRTTRRLAAAGAAAVTLCLLAAAGWYTGLIWPRLTFGNGYGSMADSAAHTFELTFEVANDGIRPVTVTGIGRDGLGLRLTSTTPAAPLTIRPGGRAEMTVAYQVTDCDRTTAGTWPIPLRVKRFAGTQEAWIHPPDRASAMAPDSHTYSGADPYAIPWQVVLVAQACERPQP